MFCRSQSQSGQYLHACNHCYLNNVDISGAVFILNLTIIIPNSQYEEGARDVNNIRVSIFTIREDLLSSSESESEDTNVSLRLCKPYVTILNFAWGIITDRCKWRNFIKKGRNLTIKMQKGTKTFSY